ncbi:MAG: H-NS histone family protein [Marivivens sp.]|jgi:DNA-binding protein H-NS|nr:H-NS histone family protein [Marivivens sp.]
MSLDLYSMSRAELEALQKDVAKALKDVDAREMKAAREAAEAAAAEHGFSLAELLGDGRKSRKSRGPVPAKYRNPENAAETWTGRGRKPKWVAAAEAAGRDLSEFEI